ncbi:MAG: DUF885 domain-containing protein [Pseudomonadota bacterium]
MRSFFLTLLATTALVACDTFAPPAAPPPLAENVPVETAEIGAEESESERLNAWFETKYEEQIAFSPIQQTFLGRDADQDKIDDFSAAAEDAQYEWLKASVEEMTSSFDYDALDPETQTSYDIWAFQLAEEEASRTFRQNAYVFEQMNAVHAFFPQLLISFHAVEDAEDMANYVTRISESGRAIEQLIERSKDNAAAGVRPPRFSFEFVIDESRKIISGAPFDASDTDSAIWADVKTKIEKLQTEDKLSKADGESLLAAAEVALLEAWKPAYEALIAWQEEDIVNAAEVAQGVSALPNGVAFYNERLANQTTTDFTADEIHEIGLSEVARIREEMEAIKAEVGYEGTLIEFFNYLRDEKDNRDLYFPNTDNGRQGYIDDATAAIENIKGELPNYFGLLPKADLIVKRVEAFREQDGAAQHYFPPTPDGSRPGTYYAHLSDMAAMPKRELEVIAYHEGLPGHHMQIAIAQELEGIPTFRTQVSYTAYIEGWALYSEWLAVEMPNTYEDAYSRFGRLGSEIWRAIRLVVDTGLHSKGWTEDEAVAYFLENAAITELQARSEVRRYLVLPGQATSYKIGMLKIQELRAKAEAELGEDFDIRGFHDTVLGGGALPLGVLEARIDRWIADIKAS